MLLSVLVLLAARPQLINALRAHKDIGTVAAISPNGRSLLTSASDGIIRIWDLTA